MSNQEAFDTINRHLSFLEQDKNNLNLLLEISDLYSELDDLESAQKYLTMASDIDREACLGYQGLLYLNQGQMNEAQTCFQEAIQITDTPALRYNLGFTYYVNNELERAKEELTAILNSEFSLLAQLLLARILHQENAIDESINLLQELLKHYPDDAEVLGFLSLLYFDTNEEELARELSQRALNLNPEMYDAQLVDVMLRLLTQETSVDEIEELLQINPHDSRLWFALGSTHLTQGNFIKAKEYLYKTLEIHPEFYDCHIALAWCQLLNNELNEAHETYQNAITLAEELADGWGGLALIYALNNDFIKAEQLINKANSIDDNCFLTELAEIIFANYKFPEKAKPNLLNLLKNNNLPTAEKLSMLMEEM